MNYKKHYTQLIAKAKARELTEGYTEVHHILPKCMGGNDSQDNLVALTPQEHFVAHLLLAKANPEIDKLWYAVHMMSITKNIHGRANNKTYKSVREHISKYMSTAVKEKWARKKGYKSYWHQVETVWNLFVAENKTPPQIEKALNIPQGNVRACIGFYTQVFPNEVDTVKRIRFEQKSLVSRTTRANISPEQEARRIAAVKAKDYTEQAKRMSESRKGKNNPNYGNKTPKEILTCPHCGYTGGSGGIHRWHFDNCRKKI